MFELAGRFADILARAIEIICNVALVIMTVVIAVLIVSRNLLDFSYPWSEEVTRLMLIWLTFLGAAALLWRNDHIQLDNLHDRLSPRANLWLSFFLRFLVLGFLVILVHQSWLTAVARDSTRYPASGVSLFWAYLSIPVAAAIMIFVTLVALWGEFLQIIGRRPMRQEDNETKHHVGVV